MSSELCISVLHRFRKTKFRLKKCKNVNPNSYCFAVSLLFFHSTPLRYRPMKPVVLFPPGFSSLSLSLPKLTHTQKFSAVIFPYILFLLMRCFCWCQSLLMRPPSQANNNNDDDDGGGRTGREDTKSHWRPLNLGSGLMGYTHTQLQFAMANMMRLLALSIS